MQVEILIFWSSALLLFYLYLGYPALIQAWARVRPRPTLSREIQPMVSLLVVAYDEGSRIDGRIQNLLALDYPRERFEILLASDGSADETVERAKAYRHAGVRVLAFEKRRGKPAVLNEMVRHARGEILVLADARQRFEPSVLRALVRPFADPAVGAVSGELILMRNIGGTAVGEGVGFYWRLEKLIRRHESLVDSTVGATGAIYALRRDLFEPIPEDTILDDVLIPLKIAARGYRVLFEPAARAYDRAAGSAGEEFSRKVRTIAGNFQLFARQTWLMNPFSNRLWLQTISHKGLRLVSPLLLLALLAASILLLERSLYRWAVAAQVIFYAAASTGFLLRNARKRVPLLIVPYVVCLLNCATIAAFLRFVTGRQQVTWKRASPGIHETAGVSVGLVSPDRSRRSA